MARSYELSISENYVPSWGVTEAVREFFQNALDEATRDADNEMFCSYDPENQILRIGNKHGKLDPKTLLFGYTEKNDNAEMIGNHGEGYKIATVVLLRLNKQITFYNYGYRQVWRPRFVNSRKYGVKVPTFFVDTKHAWQSVPDNDLVIEIAGITEEEYAAIVDSNLHLGSKEYDCIETSYGQLIKTESYKGKIFVGGLFICTDPRIDLGVNFKPAVVRIERDRSMVDSFDVQWYLARMIEQSKDKELIKSSMSTYAGHFISYSYIDNVGDDIARDFLGEHGYDAVPVSDQKDSIFAVSTNTVIVSDTMKKLILDSRYYKDHSSASIENSENTVFGSFCSFITDIKGKLTSSELERAIRIARNVKRLEFPDVNISAEDDAVDSNPTENIE